jgi:hypothetical protein
MPIYVIQCWQTKYPDYPLSGAETVEASNRDDARIMARKKWAAWTGFDECDVQARVMWNETIQREDLEYAFIHGLPEIID